MRASKLKAAVIGSTLIAVCATVSAAEDVGKWEYDNNCAACHGMEGRGDGPYAGIVNTVIPDITALQRNNNGVFPYDRVYQMIDGRTELKGHGPRAMPIWGSEYDEKAVDYYSDYLQPYNAEGFVRGRILALINYIYSLQQ